MYDILVPFLYADDPAFVLKKELFYYPIFGWYGWRAQMIPIDRGGYAKTLRKMLRRAKNIADTGRQVLIFPEGTRTRVGAPPNYKTGIYGMYAELEKPCVPIALLTGHCWPKKGILRKPGTIIVDILSPIEPGLTRRDFMERLETAIEPAVNSIIDEVDAKPELERPTE
jgi:1-acyl-sn-glycerol-3-phosphate acyltransferase